VATQSLKKEKKAESPKPHIVEDDHPASTDG